MLTVLGGGVLVLATAGVAWAAFGTSKKTSTTAGNAPQTVATAPGPIGPVIPGTKASSAVTASTPKVTPTSVPRVTATAAVATSAPTPATTSAAPAAGPVLPAATKAATAAPTKVAAPAPTKVATAKPAPAKAAPARPATQAAGAHTATAALHYTVTSRSTLWDMTVQSLRATHRATDTNTVSAYVNKLYAANRKVIGSDKDLLYAGEVITWPVGL